ncbi:5867_t:CDS:1, partial [Funneliformis geosporum]
LSIKVAKSKNYKSKYISKLRSTIQKAKKITPYNFQKAAKKLFKINKKEYSAQMVKLTTNISLIGGTSTSAVVEYIKAFYEFVVEEPAEHWIAKKTISRWNKELARLAINEHHPNNTKSNFFEYGIMVDESTRDEQKLLLICIGIQF